MIHQRIQIQVDATPALAMLSEIAAAGAEFSAAFRCRDVLAPIPGERFECADHICHAGPHHDAARTVTW